MCVALSQIIEGLKGTVGYTCIDRVTCKWMYKSGLKKIGVWHDKTESQKCSCRGGASGWTLELTPSPQCISRPWSSRRLQDSPWFTLALASRPATPKISPRLPSPNPLLIHLASRHRSVTVFRSEAPEFKPSRQPLSLMRMTLDEWLNFEPHSHSSLTPWKEW